MAESARPALHAPLEFVGFRSRIEGDLARFRSLRPCMWPVIGMGPGFQAFGDRAITYRIGAQRGNWHLYIRQSLGRQGEIRRDFPETLKGVLRV